MMASRQADFTRDQAGYRKLRSILLSSEALCAHRRTDTGLNKYNYRPRAIPGEQQFVAGSIVEHQNDNKAQRFGHLNEFWDYVGGLNVFCSNSFLKRLLVDLSDYKFLDDQRDPFGHLVYGHKTIDSLARNSEEIRRMPKGDDKLGTLNLVPLCLYTCVLDIQYVHVHRADRTINLGSLVYWLYEVPEFIELNRFLLEKFKSSNGIAAILGNFMKSQQATIGNLNWLLDNLQTFYIGTDSEIQIIMKLNTLGKSR